MPELPDVDYWERYVRATSLHKRVRRTHVIEGRIVKGLSRMRFARRLKRARLRETARHGKFLLVRFADAGWLVLNFGMTGSLAYVTNGDDPEYTRVALEFFGGARLAYQSRRMLGRVELASSPAALIEEHELGPDALSDELTGDRFTSSLQGHDKPIKSALMDQSVVAGIGNVYSDEILFQSHLRPDARTDTLRAERIVGVYQVMRRVLRVAARYDATVESFPRSYLLPHRDEGRCPRCGGRLESTRISGRTACFCPHCQDRE